MIGNCTMTKLLIACIILFAISAFVQAVEKEKYHMDPTKNSQSRDQTDAKKMIDLEWSAVSSTSPHVPVNLNLTVTDTADPTNALYTCNTIVDAAFNDTEELTIYHVGRLKNNKFILYVTDYRSKAEDDADKASWYSTWPDLVPSYTYRILDNCTIVKTLTVGNKEPVAYLKKVPSTFVLTVYEDGFDMMYNDGQRETDLLHYENYDDNGNKIGEHLLPQIDFGRAVSSGKSRSQGFITYHGYRFYPNGSYKYLEKYNLDLEPHQSFYVHHNYFNDRHYHSVCRRYNGYKKGIIDCAQYDLVNDVHVFDVKIDVTARAWMMFQLYNLKNGGMFLSLLVENTAKAYVMRPYRPTIVYDIHHDAILLDYFDEGSGFDKGEKNMPYSILNNTAQL